MPDTSLNTVHALNSERNESVKRNDCGSYMCVCGTTVVNESRNESSRMHFKSVFQL